jgi:hypothetical protein
MDGCAGFARTILPCYFSAAVLPELSRRTAEITMTRSRMNNIVPLISHFRKKTLKRKVRMTAMLSRTNALIDHFLNAGTVHSLPRSPDLIWIVQIKKIFELLYNDLPGAGIPDFTVYR